MATVSETVSAKSTHPQLDKTFLKLTETHVRFRGQNRAGFSIQVNQL